MRLILRCGIVRDTPKGLLTIHAATEEEGGGMRWFGTSFDIKALLAAVSLGVTLMMQHVNTQTTITRLQGEIETEKTARSQAEHEYESNAQHVSDRIRLQQDQIQQLFAIQLGRGGR